MKFLGVVLFALFVSVSAASAAEFFVTPGGDDANAGTKASPFATLERARDAVRSLKRESELPDGGITVWIGGGEYVRDAAFELDEADSGTAAAPIVYRARSGELPRLIGGRSIAPSDCRPLGNTSVRKRLSAAARSKVVQIDLNALGFGDVGTLPDRFKDGGGSPELFYDGQPMQLARWPKKNWVTIAEVVDRGVAPLDPRQGENQRGVRGGTFVYKEDHPANWRVDDGVWLNGYLVPIDWASECIRVASIDTAARRITLAAPHTYGLGPSSTWNKVPRRYYAINVLEELDSPGGVVSRPQDPTDLLLAAGRPGGQAAHTLAARQNRWCRSRTSPTSPWTGSRSRSLAAAASGSPEGQTT